MMRYVLAVLATLAVIMAGGDALALTGTLDINGEVLPVPLQIEKQSDMSFAVPRVIGTTTYTTPSFLNLVIAQFRVIGELGYAVNLAVPASVTLTRSGGSETADLALTCRRSDNLPVTQRSDGFDCGASGTLNPLTSSPAFRPERMSNA